MILLGFDERHTYIQANTGVATACIERAIAEGEGEGDHKLVVGGVSMGGTITRYALARMQHNGDDPQTRTYFSWDTPHLGAWIPLILQQMAHFFEDYTEEEPGEPKQAELLRSPAAQQLLWAWVENSKYQGPVATTSPLRTRFLKDLAAVGDFPTDMTRIGVTNGHGACMGLKLTPGEIAFEYRKEHNIASATARIQPDRGDKQPIGGMHIAWAVRRSSTTNVPALDGAPGGTLASFGLVAARRDGRARAGIHRLRPDLRPPDGPPRHPLRTLLRAPGRGGLPPPASRCTGCGVHHLAGHVAADALEHGPPPEPCVVLIASGCRTSLLLVRDLVRASILRLGDTLDDAVGECFDKAARILGLPYPGGPAVGRAARDGNPGLRPSPGRGRPFLSLAGHPPTAVSTTTCALYLI
ncbi:Glycoprotease family protein [Streptomyces yunnanensis]|uniref:Glycoprotease family protein n=1 Tax=Streptomyces yunnanensis TaxID=156453 RepID=A0A9X8QYP4_9ACTN|nr:Glycoprotease family protein [Streptomyces yunnanensis]